MIELVELKEMNSEKVLKIGDAYMAAMNHLLDTSTLLIKNAPNLQYYRTDLMSIMIEFMGSQARSILRSVK